MHCNTEHRFQPTEAQFLCAIGGREQHKEAYCRGRYVRVVQYRVVSYQKNYQTVT